MNAYLEELCDQLDAGLFTGSGFHDEDAVKELETYLIRWQREAERIKNELIEPGRTD